MDASAHLDVLAAKHRDLDHAIAQAVASPASNDLEIAELKRRKLRLKEKIEALRLETTH
ncbi:MAG: DUF465 domain-containing protein [Pseudomonadota bacterium]